MRTMTALAAVVLLGRVALAAEARTTPVAYVLMDARSGTVLAERDPHKRWPPASMAKMMTVLIAVER
ncbi:MAG TPA: D-alanyl-D-alanine carboxypeptidase, partial [Candidatus Binatus sp.]|nr:D-alanyl-D-alanine carboxypeptidase [Candidatus Binatus sp.]